MFVPKRPEFTGDFFLAYGLTERQKAWDDQYTNMTKAKAMEAMTSGYKVKHTSFLSDEFVQIVDGQIVDEIGCFLNDFWKYRESSRFDKGWSVII